MSVDAIVWVRMGLCGLGCGCGEDGCEVCGRCVSGFVMWLEMEIFMQVFDTFAC